MEALVKQISFTKHKGSKKAWETTKLILSSGVNLITKKIFVLKLFFSVFKIVAVSSCYWKSLFYLLVARRARLMNLQTAVVYYSVSLLWKHTAEG